MGFCCPQQIATSIGERKDELCLNCIIDDLFRQVLSAVILLLVYRTRLMNFS